MKHNNGIVAAAAREAEKMHVQRMPTEDGLAVRPFLGGTSLSVDRAQVDIAIFSAILASLPVGPGAFILDLGAGPCWVSDWLRRLKYRTCSLDICADMLRIGQERMGRGSWVCAADMAALPLRADSVDAAVCCAALHHVPNWRDVLGEVHRVLRPGGVFVMQEPGRGHSRQAESIMQMEQFGVFEQDLPPRVLSRACRDAGFTRAIVRPVAELSHGLARILPHYPFAREDPRRFARALARRMSITVVECFLNMWTPLHIVVAMKGVPYADSRRPHTMLAGFQDVEIQPRAGPSNPLKVRVCVKNTGLTRWLAAADESGAGRVQLGISRVDVERRITDLDYLRIGLSRDINPGDTAVFSAEIPPLGNGVRTYLRLDMVAEGVCWFSEKGSRPRYIELDTRE